jgi:hypothetical protein
MPQTSFSSETPQGLYNSLIYKHLKILLANGLEQPIRKQYFKHIDLKNKYIKPTPVTSNTFSTLIGFPLPFSLAQLCREVMAFLMSPPLISTKVFKVLSSHLTFSSLHMKLNLSSIIDSLRGLNRNFVHLDVRGSIILDT